MSETAARSVEPTAPSLDEAAEAAGLVQAALAGAREFLGMDVAFVGEITSGTRVVRYVDSALEDSPVRTGAADPLEETYCARVLDGRLPNLIRDASRVPEAARLPVTHDVPVGAHLSVPIILPDGRVYGTLCAFSTTPRSSLGDQDVGALRLLSTLLAGTLARDSEARRERARAVADVLEVASGDLTTVFQPVVDLRTRRAVGYEALTRFSRGRPDEWFATATRAGLAVRLEMAALERAVSHVDRLPVDAYLAVNLSPEAFCSDELAERAVTLPVERLVFEITEQTNVTSYDALVARVAWLRAAGARIALDDAGSGYAGLRRILALAPDVLKLDLDLIRGVDVDAARQSMVSAMTTFARRTGTTLVAEGIETAGELEMLLSLGVGHGQGYHLGRPGPLHEGSHESVGGARCGC